MHILFIELPIKKSARNSPEEKRGASGGFLPRPLLRAGNQPRQGKSKTPEK